MSNSNHTIAVMCGHGTMTDGRFDSGCTYGKYTEAELMLPITKSAVKYLRYSGVTVITDADNGNNRNIITGVSIANQKKAELFVSIHCDYSKAKTGVYPLYVSAKGKAIAKILNDTITKSLGMKSRGLGKRTDLYELNYTDMPAVILETGAIKADLRILRDKPDAYGKAIAKALCLYLGVTFRTSKTATSTTTPTPTGKKVNYQVEVKSNINIRSGAGTSYKKVKTCPIGTYSIVEELNGWGKLKSGDGWIYLGFTTKIQPEAKTTKTTGTNKTAEKILNESKKLGDAIVSNKFVYSNSGSKTTYASALKTNKRVNCARYASWVAQLCGLIAKGKVFYYTNKLKGSGANALLNSSKLKTIKPNKTAKNYTFKPGDIVCFDNHTMIFSGYINNHPYWYSFGGSDVKAFRSKGKFYKRRKSGYDNKKIRYVFRPED